MSYLHWAILAAVFAGITAVLAKAGTKEVEPNLATAIRTSIVLVITWGIYWIGRQPGPVSVSTRAIVFLTLSGIATGLSWLCYFRALHLGPVSSVAPIDKLSIIFAILLAALFLGEAVVWQHWVGGLLIVLGAVLIATV